ncbi:flagellar hook-associated protein 3 [Arthrobacter sp. TPD3018]|jgi:flagellar hook-associated protein 3 FlgL|uniref:flagellar hook-associated protein FlgL n=1 Tax=Bacteria TaxID=2 RepID=UPI000D50BC99|nr:MULTISPECIES: flagellar hook-associated protein FlgL [Bacteria]PVE51654.1 flagellar hook-associated protein 3 [Sphingomonas sp. TPD3009]PVE52623.1 flagellar hook-associated protein 3 [Arthrobacter sp. TPD3018]PVE80751.1 flagellar hook-associated protein 3 [Sphingomonas melonis]RTL14712.1 MAG: flagellar hook-associated protein 3 [Sphingomonadaceae bacterium]
MQISTSLFYSNASSRLSKMSDKASELQTQIATGKKLIKPSDDPAGAQQLAELDRRDADAAVYGTNLTLASSLLDQADGVLKQITTQLTRATELATQAATGTQTDAARKSIATEITSVVQSLVTLANSRNVRGQPLFGTVDGTKAVTDNGNGTFTFPANNTLVSEVPIADGQTIQATESAKTIFDLGNGDNTLAMLSRMAATLNGGGDVSSSMSTALDSLSQAVDQVANVQASVGSRSARVDLQQQLLTTANTDRAELRGKLEQVDVTDAIVQLQQMMTALSASQASFTKLSQLSLFDYLK